MRSITGCLTIFLLACSSTPDSKSDEVGANGGKSGSGGGAAMGGSLASPGGGSAGALGSAGNSSAGNAGATNGGTGMAGASTGGTSGSGSGMSIQCASKAEPGLPEGAPALTPGMWTNVSPSGITWGDNGHAVGFTVNPCNPAVLYVGIGSFDSSTGVFRSTNAGGSWTKIATGGDPSLNGGDMTRVDPNDPQHLYFVAAVRGTMGFFESFDAGDTIEIPQGFKDIGDTAGIYQWDVYDIDTDPTDFKHVLLSFHGAWGWTDTKWDTNSGVLESKDGGDTWIVHEPLAGWGTGHAIHFLYDPETGQGDSNTWLLGTQGSAGMQRTTDAGATWTKVSDVGIQHGGGKIYYTAAGTLYATSGDKILKSTDNGETWKGVGDGGGYNGIIGDGEKLYTAKCFGPTAIKTSLETDGETWTDFNAQQFSQGPFELGFDPDNRIVYASLWGAGVWALELE